MGQTSPSTTAKFNIERSYANRILQESMNRIIDITVLEKEKIMNLFFLKRLNLRCDLYM